MSYGRYQCYNLEMMSLKPISFIDEKIEVQYNQEPTYLRTPYPPDRFLWRDKIWYVVEVLEEWKDFDRRGKAAHNMRPANLLKASSRGSRGVGRFYYRVLTEDDRIFQLYFDRSGWNEEKNESGWVLHSEYSYAISQKRKA